MSTVSVIDYGMGNLHSIAKALQQVASPSQRILVTHEPDQILNADHIVFPGVGAMRDCMSQLHALELAEVVREVSRQKPFLGICLGMQALLDRSDENNGIDALGIIPGHVRHFGIRLTSGDGAILKIPHMGWNRVNPVRPHPLWQGIPAGSWFYFVHSYHVCPSNTADQAATTDYPLPFTSALTHENLFAVQFHPEKSQSAGLRLLANFLAWDGTCNPSSI